MTKNKLIVFLGAEFDPFDENVAKKLSKVLLKYFGPLKDSWAVVE